MCIRDSCDSCQSLSPCHAHGLSTQRSPGLRLLPLARMPRCISSGVRGLLHHPCLPDKAGDRRAGLAEVEVREMPAH
eukprot:576249-Alexandrium_andersonii.AAC.1